MLVQIVAALVLALPTSQAPIFYYIQRGVNDEVQYPEPAVAIEVDDESVSKDGKELDGTNDTPRDHVSVIITSPDLP